MLLHQPSQWPAGALLLWCCAFAGGCKDRASIPSVALPEVSDLGRLLPEIRADLERATAALRARPGDPELWAQLGLRYESSGLPESASRCFREALALAPQNAKWAYRLAVNLARSGDLEGALRWAKTSTNLDPSYATTLQRLGDWSLQLGRLEDAKQFFQRATSTPPNQPAAWAGLARVALQEDDANGALAWIEKTRKVEPEEPYWKLLHGTVLAQLGRESEALPLLKAGQGSKPAMYDPWALEAKSVRSIEGDRLQQGKDLEAQGQMDAAIAIYRELYAARPGEARLPHLLARALLLSGRNDEALAVTQQALENFPSHLQLLTLYGALLDRKGDAQGAWKASNDAIRGNPTRPDGYLFQASLLAKQGSLEQATSVAHTALELAPSDDRSIETLASLLARQGQHAEAIELLENGLQQFGLEPPLSYYGLLAQSLKATGQNAKLLELTERVRALQNPSSPPKPR